MSSHVTARRSWSLRAILLGVWLGGIVAVCWLGFGLSHGRGFGFQRTVIDAGPLLYATLVAASALLVGVLVWRGWLEGRPSRLVLVLLGAWLVEGVAFGLVGPMLDDDIDATNAIPLWLLATGFGLQPLSGMLGGLAAIALRRSSRAARSDRTG